MMPDSNLASVPALATILVIGLTVLLAPHAVAESHENEHASLEACAGVGYLLPSEPGFVMSSTLKGAGRATLGIERRVGGSVWVGAAVDAYYRRLSPDYLLPPTKFTLGYFPLSVSITARHRGPEAGESAAHFLTVGAGIGRGSLSMKEDDGPREVVRGALPCVYFQVGARGSLFDFRLEYRFVKPLRGTMMLDTTWPYAVDEDLSGLSLLIGLHHRVR